MATGQTRRPLPFPSQTLKPTNTNGTNATAVLVTITPIGVYPVGAPASIPGITFCLIGDSTYTPATGGQGGWQIVDRPRSVAGLQWYDRSPMMLTLPLLIDSEVINGLGGESIENACQTLDTWQDKVPGTNMPLIFTLTGPVPGIQHQWALYTLSFGEAIRDGRAGFRTQQKVDVTLYEYNSVLQSTLNTPSPAAQAAYLAAQQGSSAQGYYIYTVVAGDTLETIAGRLLNNYAEWQSIAVLNNIRDPNNIVPGQQLLIPNS